MSYDNAGTSARSLTRTALVVMHDATVRELLALSLRQSGFYPVGAESADEGLRMAAQVQPDVVLIDLDAPALTPADRDSLCTGMNGQRIPSVMLSSWVQETCGATLFVAKPFVPREVVAGLLAALPRQPLTRLRVGAIEVDPARHRVTVQRGRQAIDVEMADAQRRLLYCFLEHPDEVLSREQLLDLAWGVDSGVDPRTVDQNIKRARQRLETAGAAGVLQTVRGHGYRLKSRPG